MENLKIYEETPAVKPEENSFICGVCERRFDLGLVCDGFTYYICISECDDNANTICYRPDGSLASDNYFASGALAEDIENIHAGKSSATFMSEAVRYNMTAMEEAGYFDE